jgi:hypothetical protein
MAVGFMSPAGAIGEFAEGSALATRLGRIGEETIRGLENIGPATRFYTPAGRLRIADGMLNTAVSEVKNVKYLSLTRQIRDYVQYSKSTGRTFQLFTRGSTKLSGPLQDMVDTGAILLRRVL